MDQTNGERTYINNEICTYMTSNKLLAFSDRMNLAPYTDYACIHAKGDIGVDGRRVYSTIGILASDFSQGKGENNVRAEANISPAEARYIYHWAQMGIGRLDASIFSSTKIFGTPDPQGYAPVRKLTIGRIQKDNEGNNRTSPWLVTIENGVGIKAQNANGGSYCKKDTFISHRKVHVFLTDQDFFCHMAQVVAFINVWEVTNGAKLIREGRTALEVAKAEYAAAQAENPQYNHSASYDDGMYGNGGYDGNDGYGAVPPSQIPPQTHQSNPSQNPKPNQSSQPPKPQGNNGAMTLEQARNVVISMGTHKGKTLGQLEREQPNGIAWYVNNYKGKDEQLRTGANVIVGYNQSLSKAS